MYYKTHQGGFLSAVYIVIITYESLGIKERPIKRTGSRIYMDSFSYNIFCHIVFDIHTYIEKLLYTHTETHTHTYKFTYTMKLTKHIESRVCKVGKYFRWNWLGWYGAVIQYEPTIHTYVRTTRHCLHYITLIIYIDPYKIFKCI